MEIRSIKLVNFRQFKNINIEFSCDKERNVTVLIGNNTAGKTTLVKAFAWCLYRVNKFADKILLNRDICENLLINGEETVKVVLDLDHKGCSYTITTKEVYFRTPNGIRVKTKAFSNVIKSSSEETVVIPQIKVEEEINAILGPALKDYFFFDGEDNNIYSIAKKSNLKDAVSDLMGLKRMEQLNEYYDPTKSDSVTSKLKSKLVTSDEGSLANYFDLLSDAQEKLNELKKELDEINENIVSLEAQKLEKEELIDANLDVKEDQDRKKQLNKDIINAKKYKDDQFRDLINSINNSNALLKILFSKSYYENNLENKLSETTFKSENSLKHISEEAIDLIIQRGKCLCGTLLANRNDLIEHLKSEKEHMEPRDFGKYASDFSDAEKNNFSYAKSMSENIKEMAEKLIEIITNLDINKENLKEVEKRIIGRVNVGELQEDSLRISQQIATQKGTAKYIENTAIPEKNAEISKYNKLITSLTANTAGNEIIQECIDYAEYIYKQTSKRIDEAKTKIRVDLEKTVNEIFKSMYHGNRVITIDKNFNADAKLVGNVSLDKSNGLETVKNFAFVTGLMELIKKKITSEASAGDDFVDSEGEVYYPLIMDAPFSDTDEIHIRNICNVLPYHCNQVIIVVMNKDFESAKDAMGSKISKMYKIIKKDNSETDSIIEEVL